MRDSVHVLGVASAHVLAREALDHRSVRYNLGNGAGHSVKRVIDVARRVTSYLIPVAIGPRRACDQAVLVASAARIRQESGWRPNFADIETIAETAWNWHRAHPNRYESSATEPALAPPRRANEV